MNEEKNNEQLDQQLLEAEALLKQEDLQDAQNLEDTAEFALEDILKEFGVEEAETPAEEVAAGEETEQVRDDAPAQASAAETEAPVSGDTIRISVPQASQMGMDIGDTIQFAPVAGEEEQPPEEEAPKAPVPEKAEPYSDSWEPEYDQPMGDYVPPQPIVFHPRSKLHALKKKLVAGPERRYYELSEHGLGKLQFAIFMSLLVAALSVTTAVLYSVGAVSPERLKLMVFSQFFTMLMSALLGCYQLMDGIGDIFRGKFNLNSMLVVTFLACCVDGALCLQQQRVPCCSIFCLQVTMSLWSTYHRRHTQIGQMDTLRKATDLHGVIPTADYLDGQTGYLRGEGRLEDFMDNYEKPGKAERTLNIYALIATGLSIVIGAVAGVLHQDVSFGVQTLAVTLLVSVPVTSFITASRPAAILEKRLHKLGAVLCNWDGVEQLSGKGVFALKHTDLFPVGACKLNGVKFYGSRDPDQVVAYCTAVVSADGGGLAPLFNHLLDSRNGRHYPVENLRVYPEGGVGGEVCGEAVLLGTSEFLSSMGVEVPQGMRISQAVYAAIDGELSGVFAVAYSKVRSAATGIATLCSYRKLRTVVTGGDFMLTDEFIRARFNVKTRRMVFPDRDTRQLLAERTPEEDAPCAALVTNDSLAPFAYAITGGRSLRSAAKIGMIINLLGGAVGIAMLAVLAVLGARELLTPVNVLLYELAWLIPGLLVTEWTRSV